MISESQFEHIPLSLDEEVAIVAGAVLKLSEGRFPQVDHVLHRAGVEIPDIKDRRIFLIAEAGRHKQLAVLDE